MAKKRRKNKQNRRKQFRIRRKQLTELGFDDYSAYISSQVWIQRRARYLATHPRACAVCEATEGPMILHHLFYDRLGHELDSDLVALCGGCHDLAHQWPHFGPSCVALMRAAWEEYGDPSRPNLERLLRVRDHELQMWRKSKGLPLRELKSVRVFTVNDLDDEAKQRYALERNPSAASVAEFERPRRYK